MCTHLVWTKSVICLPSGSNPQEVSKGYQMTELSVALKINNKWWNPPHPHSFPLTLFFYFLLFEAKPDLMCLLLKFSFVYILRGAERRVFFGALLTVV